MEEYSFLVPEQQSGLRLDMFLMASLSDAGLVLSRTSVQKLIAAGKVTLAGASPKPHYKLKAGEKLLVEIQDAPDTTPEPENIPLRIIFEDADLAVIDKPAGLVVHPAPGNMQHTLVNALLYHVKVLSTVNPARPGIVHRLDKETSGALVVAKNNESHLALSRQFEEHSIKRLYVALVEGKVEFNEDVIELPIGRHPVKRKSMSVSYKEESKYAKTYYRTLIRADEFSVLELKPFTGRTHQLRVHLSFLGHPIMGDATYGAKKKFSRLALHAKVIGFAHPRTKETVEFSSPVPPEFSAFLKDRGLRDIF